MNGYGPGTPSVLTNNCDDDTTYFSPDKRRQRPKEKPDEDYQDVFYQGSSTADKGKEYEDALATIAAFKLSHNSDVVDFELSSNDDDFLSFDDFVATVNVKGVGVRQVAAQLKHGLQANSIVTKDSFVSDKGDFCLKKYFKDFREIKTKFPEHIFVIYTNRSMGSGDKNRSSQYVGDVKVGFKGKSHFFIRIFKSCLGEGCEIITDVLNTSKGVGDAVHKFEAVVNQKSLEERKKGLSEEERNEIDEWNEFFARFYLFANQGRVNEVEDRAAVIFKDQYKCSQDCYVDFSHFIANWSKSEEDKNKLTKRLVMIKIAESLLAPYIKSFPPPKSNEKIKILERTVLRFDLTLVESFEEVQLWSFRPQQPYNFEAMKRTAGDFYVVFRKVEKIEEFSEEEVVKILWHKGEAALVIDFTEASRQTVLGAFRILGENPGEIGKKFVLVGNADLGEELGSSTVFRNLGDLPADDQDYLEISKNFECNLQGRKATTIADIIKGDHELRKFFAMKELVKMTTSYFCIGEDLEFVPRHFFQTSQIEKWLRGFPRDNSGAFRPNLNNEIILICAATGMGKTVLLNHLKNNFTNDFWVLKINLRDNFEKFSKNTHPSYYLNSDPSTRSYTDFEKKIKAIFLVRSEFVILWDGMDEIPRRCLASAVDTIKEMGEFCNQWVTSRSELGQFLETSLKVSAFTIENLSEREEENFLTDRLGSPLEIFEKLSLVDGRTFLSVFHHIDLVSEVLTVDRNINLEGIIRFVVEEKFLHFQKKANVDFSNSSMKLILRGSTRYRHFQYEAAAMKNFFALPELGCDGFLETLRQLGDDVGFIVRVEEGLVPVFSHEAFLYYFAARWLMKNLDKEEMVKSKIGGEEFEKLKIIGNMIPSETLTDKYPRPEFIELKKDHETSI